MKIKLLVIRCSNIEESKKFYEELEMNFVKKCHGTGSIYYSTQIEDSIFKLYPSSQKFPVCKSRIGFELNMESEELDKFNPDFYSYQNQEIYVIEDPDGRKVEISLIN